jgi:hypothetical protein
MDDFTKKHLETWLDYSCVDEEQKDILREKIMAFISENPDVLDRGYSWPEIRNLVER